MKMPPKEFGLEGVQRDAPAGSLSLPMVRGEEIADLASLWKGVGFRA
jgi:hypothetical protein